jgi:hypothetical protein
MIRRARCPETGSEPQHDAAHAAAGREAFDATDRSAPDEQTWLQRFDGERWRLFGDVVDVTK